MKAELINHMGSDLTVVNAARVSFDKESDWELSYSGAGYDQVLTEKDQKLISYLARNNHFTPFTHCVVTLRETVPIFVARQRFKHTVGFTYNEVSRRYVDETPTFFTPSAWRKRADNKKQGSSDEIVESFPFYPKEFDSIEFSRAGENLYEHYLTIAKSVYDIMLREGVAPEQARMVLPQSMYTSYYVTGSLSAWARAYNLRSDPHAQLEIQDLAKQWKDLIQPLFPVSWRALCESS